MTLGVPFPKSSQDGHNQLIRNQNDAAAYCHEVLACCELYPDPKSGQIRYSLLISTILLSLTPTILPFIL